MLLCLWDNGFRDRKPVPKQEHPTDAITQPPRPDPNRLRRHPPGGQRWAAPSGYLGPAPRPFPTGTGAPGPGRCAGPGQHRRQDHDAGSFRAGGRRLHRRRRCVAHRGDGPHPGRHGQGAIHPGHLPAQLHLGPRPSTGPGEPPVAGLGRRSRTGRRAVHHRPGFHHLRDLPTNQRCHAAIGAPGGAYVVRSPASDMGTSW